MILGEPISAMQLAGAALVLVGVLLVTLRSSASRAAAPDGSRESTRR